MRRRLFCLLRMGALPSVPSLSDENSPNAVLIVSSEGRSWGSYFHTFCDEHSKICGENPDDIVIKKNNLTSLMSSIWSAHLDEYEQSVRECIPTSKLLNISLGWYNETSETKRFQSFFGPGVEAKHVYTDNSRSSRPH